MTNTNRIVRRPTKTEGLLRLCVTILGAASGFMVGWMSPCALDQLTDEGFTVGGRHSLTGVFHWLGTPIQAALSSASVAFGIGGLAAWLGIILGHLAAIRHSSGRLSNVAFGMILFLLMFPLLVFPFCAMYAGSHPFEEPPDGWILFGVPIAALVGAIFGGTLRRRRTMPSLEMTNLDPAATALFRSGIPPIVEERQIRSSSPTEVHKPGDPDA